MSRRLNTYGAVVMATLAASSPCWAQAEDVRYVMYEGVSKALFPDGPGSEFLILLDTAIPVDGSSPESREAVLRLADALPQGAFLSADAPSVTERIKRHLSQFQFAAPTKAQLTKDQAELLFEDEEQQVPTSTYKVYLDRAAALEKIEDENRGVDPADLTKVELGKARRDAALVALRAVPQYREIDPIHRRIARNRGGAIATQVALEARIAAPVRADTFPAPEQWAEPSGALAVSFTLKAPFRPSGVLANSPPMADPAESLFSSVPAAAFASSGGRATNRQPMTPSNAVRVQMDIKRVLIRPTDQPLELLLSDDKWTWKPAQDAPKFSTGRSPLGGTAGSLINARIHSLIIARRITITGPFAAAEYSEILAAVENPDTVVIFGSIPLKSAGAGKPAGFPSFTPALSRYEIVLSQPMIIGGIGSVIPER
ncbi:MAG: hypothetical protein KF859_02550 [Phycisphaeraceae bacterium]|nr:hypothetical protein [Phycisphaeraceae bacterium]